MSKIDTKWQGEKMMHKALYLRFENQIVDLSTEQSLFTYFIKISQAKFFRESSSIGRVEDTILASVSCFANLCHVA